MGKMWSLHFGSIQRIACRAVSASAELLVDKPTLKAHSVGLHVCDCIFALKAVRPNAVTWSI